MKRAAIRAEQYRNKAEEVRIIAESMKHEATRAVLLSVAQDYLSLAAMLDREVADWETIPDPSPPEL